MQKFQILFLNIFVVLLPAFDGRPGRTNINATQDIPVPTTMTPKDGKNLIELLIENIIELSATISKRISTTDALAAANMTLYIRGPSPPIPGVCILWFLFHFIYCVAFS